MFVNAIRFRYYIQCQQKHDNSGGCGEKVTKKTEAQRGIRTTTKIKDAGKVRKLVAVQGSRREMEGEAFMSLAVAKGT
jgi:hypothetical protein